MRATNKMEGLLPLFIPNCFKFFSSNYILLFFNMFRIKFFGEIFRILGFLSKSKKWIQRNYEDLKGAGYFYYYKNNCDRNFWDNHIFVFCKAIYYAITTCTNILKKHKARDVNKAFNKRSSLYWCK